MMNRKLLLMILDGWGIASDPKASAIDQAQTPFIDALYKRFPNCQLEASGMAVGLPKGQMGNSEVGHMNIGAGRVVYQNLVRITKDFHDGGIARNQTLQKTFEYIKEKKKNLHFIGLVSDGGIHAHIDHLKELCTLAHKNGVSTFYVHAFTDGRDTDPKSGAGFISDLQNYISPLGGKIASITGRYYAMDRDKRWERVKLAYDALVNGIGKYSHDLETSIKESYQDNITDEFITPIIKVNQQNEPIAKIQDGDAVICFNFRTDRGREITEVLTQKAFDAYNMHPLKLHYVTMTNYDESFKDIKVVMQSVNLTNTLGEILAKNEKKQIRIAETEKYPHVTFFFSGGREALFKGEKRILCPSPKVATYDQQPEMSAYDIRDKIIPEIIKQETDFICLNFANPDMVGHTGVFAAAVEACETVDKCTKTIVETAIDNNYMVLIIADHGNADYMINPDGSPNTAHTTNPVPCILINTPEKYTLNNGKLADIAPTILNLLEIEIPKEMTGQILLVPENSIAK